ncbi:MAG: DUF6089 family protein [bacterium]
MRIFLSTLFTVTFLYSVHSQDFEAGIYGGGSYYLGDLNPSANYSGTQLAYGVIARYNFDNRWAVKFNAYRGKLKANSASSWFLPERDLQFTSPVTDISAVAEFNFLPYFTGSKRNFITPYVYAGIGIFFFKPMSGGVELRPLGTEGQKSGYDGRKPYSLFSVNVPFGLGVKVSVSSKIGLALFWEMHKTFTDYLDDASTTYYLDGTTIDPDNPQQYFSDPAMDHQPGMQRGNSKNQDWYSFSGITITYKFALAESRRCKDIYSN